LRASIACICRQRAQPLICEARIFTSSTKPGSSPACTRLVRVSRVERQNSASPIFGSPETSPSSIRPFLLRKARGGAEPRYGSIDVGRPPVSVRSSANG
jgi:hypothetical protein